MKIIISYPPLEGPGSPMLTQNRQFQWYRRPSYIYPVVPAMAATLLRNDGFEVIWNDCIAERWTQEQFYDFVEKKKPDIIAFESKTPVIKQHWKIIDKLRKGIASAPAVPRNDGWMVPRNDGQRTTQNAQRTTILMGDHVTALPQESMKNSSVDFVITGGDYDLLLLNIARCIRDGTPLGKGIWYRQNGAIKNTGNFELEQDLNKLPFIDRRITKAHLYGEKWKKRVPFFYTMAGRDCLWGRCSFCSWCFLYPKPRLRKPDNLLDEIEMLVKDHGAKEIFDDMGTFPSGGWLNEFCEGMIERGLNRKILFSCNMRFGALSRDNIEMMKKAGFRKLKMGLESANQATLDRINKGVEREQIIQECKDISRVGLKIHLTVMIGYPWETKEDALNTLRLAQEMMSKGWVEMLQSTILVPYPGTALYEEGLKKNWFRSDPKDYERYDMSEPVFRLPDMGPEEATDICRGIYRTFFSPAFIMRNLKDARRPSDLAYIFRGAIAAMGHIADFARKR